MLEGLGWELGRLSRDIIEEARIRGTAMLRMDYAGVNPATLRARLIVEAKAWDKRFVSASDDGRRQCHAPTSPESLLAKGIEHYKQTLDVAGSPVIGEWAEIHPATVRLCYSGICSKRPSGGARRDYGWPMACHFHRTLCRIWRGWSRRSLNNPPV
jgi:hypothetical protein